MRRRPAYILLAVLGLATIVTAMGLSFLDSHGTSMPQAVNYHRSVRAQYLAESGVALASHFLMYPPTAVAFDGYYQGANGIAIDATSDYTDVVVARSDAWTPAGTDPNLYRITAVGVAHDPDGAVRGKRRVSAEVLLPPANKWQIPYACFHKKALTVPSRVSLYGNVHANGALIGSLNSFCNGAVTATLAATWLGDGPPTSVASLQPSYVGPTGSLSKYANYTIKGKSYAAYTGYSNSELKASDAAGLNAMDMSATNPGRLILCKSGDFVVRAGVDLQGTLLVSGRLEIEDAGTSTLRAEAGFPALIVSDDIRFNAADSALAITGSVICAGAIDLERQARTSLNITGALVLSDGFEDIPGDGVVRATWDAERSSFWDVESTPTPEPITVLSWKEE